MTLLTATYALENMTVPEGNLHIVDLLQASELIPADLTPWFQPDDWHAELERVLDLPFILEGPSFAVATTWDDLTADD